MRLFLAILRFWLRPSSRSARCWIGRYAFRMGNHPRIAEARMTATNPLQLHLFDATPDPTTIPPDRRQRLVTLTGVLLSEVVQARLDMDEPSALREAHDE
jgi:hypothetical protein